MTRAYAKLLGPCFKTGRIDDQLLHRDGERELQHEHDNNRQVSHVTLTSDSRARAKTRRPFPAGQNAARTIIHQPGFHFPREVPSKLGFQSPDHTSQRTPLANALPAGNRSGPTNQPEAGLFGRPDHRPAAEYKLDTLTLSVSILSVSRPL